VNDPGVERISKEREFVNDELHAAVGLSGRDRKISDPAETPAPADRQGDSFSIERNLRARSIARSSPLHVNPRRVLLRLTCRPASAVILEVIGS